MYEKIRKFGVVLLVMLMAPLGNARGAVVEMFPEDVRSRGGLCIMIGGAEEPALAEALLEAGPWTVHWLDADPAAVENARNVFQDQEMYGRISVEHWLSDRLPHADNLANVIVINTSGLSIDRDELLRVLAPEGTAFVPADNGFEPLTKSRPADMGDWTHYWHDPAGSMTGADHMLEPPNAFQWLTGPAFPLGVRRGDTTLLSAGGRIFYVSQNAPENLADRPGINMRRMRYRAGGRYLMARDAFNGVLLWSKRWDGPGGAEAFIATDDHFYGPGNDAVKILDTSDGTRLVTLPMAATPNRLALDTDSNLLVAQSEAGLTGFDMAEKEKVWFHETNRPAGLLLGDGKAYCLVSAREDDGRWSHDVLAVHMQTGDKLWMQPVESEYGDQNNSPLRLHVAGDGFVSLLERYVLRVLASDDGRELWRRESRAQSRGAQDSRRVGHFLAEGLIWFREHRATGGRAGTEAWSGLEPLTGEVVKEVNAEGPMGVISNVNKISCQRLTATERFLLDARLSTMWDLETGARSGYKFTRGGCVLGMIPANGLAYTVPNNCGCLAEQVRGHMAVTRTQDPGLLEIQPVKPEKGPAFGHATDPLNDDGAGRAWPTYRRDGRRGAYLPATVTKSPEINWETRINAGEEVLAPDWRLSVGRTLTPPVIADDRVLLADPQSHQVIALDAATGDTLWSFAAGGRISTPPTLYRGLALFGAHDGYVYALRATDGELVWRRRAAPSDRRIMAYGQLESAWPVIGGVMVHEGLALAAAGRAVDADGGLVVHAVEPATGETVWSRRVDSARYGVNDPLTTDGEHVYMMDQVLDAQTGEVTALSFHYGRSDRGGAQIGYPAGHLYLRGGKTGLHEISWTRVKQGLRKKQSAWTWGPFEGELMAIDDDGTVYTYQIDLLSSSMWGGSPPLTVGGGELIAWNIREPEPYWQFELPEKAQIESIVVTADAVFISGPRDRSEPFGPGFLKAVGRDNGEMLSEISLPVAPVHDGLAAAEGNLYAVLRNGRVLGLAEAAGEE